MQLLKINLKAFLACQACIHTSVLPVNDIANTGIAYTASRVSCVIPGATQKPEIKSWQVRVSSCKFICISSLK